ncbi:MAG: tRNA (N6-isopentenyl adenosine(37)-C2)-methylthiotransferase MiaB [Acidimicrobiia bacterium]|nr:tRNA (N6-isopentenyl adenosine(37)-C2)-methylthiotransferase MiaB [Acidimicrobiia bacterium]NNL28855.1 tRNA (N6-isopentenyl adenosine(37)-C2)-methylthiotransferase MiaB [Acidimicrobiia bacterium]
MVAVALPTRRERRLPTRSGKSYFIRTFGCQMNEHDSERIAGLLEADGMNAVASIDEADLVVLNTCAIRENADNRLYGNLGHLKADKDARPELQIAVGGCLAQKDRTIVRDRAPWVDVVFGTHNIDRLVSLLDQADEWGPVTEILDESSSVPDLPAKRDDPHRAWVTIMIGCNNSCTFCIVPSLRGAEMSRRPSDVVSEVRRLVADGVVEVTLLGQNVNSYGRDLDLGGRKPLFADLLRQVGAVEGLERIFYTSPHPKDFNRDVAEAMAETEAVCEHLHLPLQSGSDRVLAAMHRGYNAERFLGKVEMAREVLPDLALTTDIIVGFPGESEDEFQATLDVVAASQFDSAFTFIYSPRPGTAAAGMVDDFIDPDVVRERYLRLTGLQDEISFDKNKATVGQTLRLLSGGPSRKDDAVTSGRSRTNKTVNVAGSVAAGQLFDAEVTIAHPHHLTGRLV